MAFKNHSSRIVPSSSSSTSLPFSLIITLALIFCSSYYIFFSQFDYSSVASSPENPPFAGDLRNLTFPWNKLSLGPISEKLKLAVFCKSWPVGSIPGGMERHAYTLYTSLASRGHEIHVFTVSSDRSNNENREEYYKKGDLHIYFAPNQYGVLNLTHAFKIFNRINGVDHPFDYVHTESDKSIDEEDNVRGQGEEEMDQVSGATQAQEEDNTRPIRIRRPNPRYL